MTRTFLIASAIFLSPSAFGQQAPKHSNMNHDGHVAHGAPPDHAMDGHDMTGHDMPDHGMAAMAGAFGAYPSGRDSSGTSWAPDITDHGGVHTSSGDWMLMGHATLQGVYSWQDGPRGDEMLFGAGMVMGSARRTFANDDTLQFRAMISPDPLMGKDGYPLLLASGETADGVEPLIDRQHPHDLFMELSASYASQLTDSDSLFVYAGLPGEPAFGPPAFMHRPAAMDSPEAPITHHWLDSTHITFGVVTAGWIHNGWKIETSRFHGREPDQHRYDIETGDLDSSSVRVSWNPTANWSLQTSWADVTSPEQLEPDEDEQRWSASALYARDVEGMGRLSFTGAFGRKERSDGVKLDGWVAEASLKPNDKWTLFSRAEGIETDELGGDHHGPIEDAARIGVGAVRDWRIGEHSLLGVGANLNRNFVSGGLDPLYGGDRWGATTFVRLKIG